MAPPPSPPRTVYVHSRGSVANGVEQTNPEERALVASAQYRIHTTSTTKTTRLRRPLQLFTTLKNLFAKSAFPPSLRVPPAMVLPSLLLGSEYNASRFDELYSLGVTHICNLDFASRNYFEGKFVYIKLNLVDAPETDLARHFEGVSQFCEGCDAVGGRVLVHCATGNALAPAFVVAYLMTRRAMSMDDALHLTRGLRPTVQLYPSFHEQLRQVSSSLT